MLNILAMALDHYAMGWYWQMGLDAVQRFFTAVFALEAATKIVALFPTEYFASRWNCFDFAIVCGSIIGIATGNASGKLANMLRVFRVLRIFRLVRLVVCEAMSCYWGILRQE